MSHSRYVFLSFLLGSLLLGAVAQIALASGFEQFAVPDNRVMGLLTYSSILGIVIGAVCFLGLIRNVRAVTFTTEVVDELSKVTWPTKDETLKATKTVIYTTLIVSSVLASYDFVWKNIADAFLYTEG